MARISGGALALFGLRAGSASAQPFSPSMVQCAGFYDAIAGWTRTCDAVGYGRKFADVQGVALDL